jgi:glutathione synthase/RimK-type ligase-like ATP-grasp enzyme
MRKKKIIVYFKKERKGTDPFLKFGKKRDVYHHFFRKGMDEGFEMYISSGKENYVGNKWFKARIYDGKQFSLEEKIIEADVIYDRSGGLDFPTEELNQIVMNRIDFKILCNDKSLMFEQLGEYMPKSITVKNKQELISAIKQFDCKRLAVLKPTNGMCGRDIKIDFPEKLKETVLKEETKYILQEFVDTSAGIKGIVSGPHDLRVVVVAGKIVLAHVRMPKEGTLLANVAQGGSIEEIALEKIPTQAVEITKKVQEILDKKYNFPIYSIDFGLENEKVCIFELNDQIGFPLANMKNACNFVNHLIFALGKLAQ